jgi:hypothetical protein
MKFPLLLTIVLTAAFINTTAQPQTNVKPAELQKLQISYEVKYPKGTTIGNLR